MSESMASVKLQGNLTVGFRQVAGLWHANALQFDIIGTGHTKDSALQQLKELVAEYLASVIAELKKGHRVEFFNPADSAEWNKARYVEEFAVCIIGLVPVSASASPSPLNLSRPSAVRNFRGPVRSIELAPA